MQWARSKGCYTHIREQDPYTASAGSNAFCVCPRLQEEKQEKQPPRFQLSSLSPQERIDYSHLIEELGTTPSF